MGDPRTFRELFSTFRWISMLYSVHGVFIEIQSPDFRFVRPCGIMLESSVKAVLRICSPQIRFSASFESRKCFVRIEHKD